MSGFWTGRKVLITGHTGFKGAWLSLWLHKLGAEVAGYSLPAPTVPSLYRAAGMGELVSRIGGDVRHLPKLCKAVEDFKPQMVFHLAAQPIVSVGREAPVATFETNVMGTVNVLEAVRLGPQCPVVVVTSDKCYESNETKRAHIEPDRMGGRDPYSSSKGCAELAVSAYRQSYGMRVASARAGNVIGGGDWGKGRIVPDMLRCSTEGQPCVLRSPKAVRPWQHVLSALHGYLLLAERLSADAAFAGGWNFGPQESKSVAWLAEKFVEVWGSGSVQANDSLEDSYLSLDSAKAVSMLCWRSPWGIENSLENTISWHKAYRMGANMRQFSLLQIKEYEDGYDQRVVPTRSDIPSAGHFGGSEKDARAEMERA